MKKVILLLALASLIMLTTVAVDSYSSAEVNSETKLNIANPNSPIMLITEEDLIIRQGESKTAITIINNMKVAVNYTVEIEHMELTLLPAAGTILPDHPPVSIEVAVDNNCDPQILSNVPVILYADFSGGDARIQATLDLEVQQGKLELVVTEDSIIAFWNNNDAPDDTKYFYRYRESETHGWPEYWTPISHDSSVEKIKAVHGPGEYDFKVQLGNNKAQLSSPIKVLSSEETEKTEQEALTDKYFKHEVKGLPNSDTNND